MKSMTMSEREKTYTGIPTATIVLWFAIVSMIMLFAGLTSGYIVRRAEGRWDSFQLPVQFTFSTIIILLSSISLQSAIVAVKRNSGLYKSLLFTTLFLGFAFIFCQFLGYSALIQEGKFFASKDNVSGSFVYAITGLHLAHLAGGILFLLYVCVRAIMDKYSSADFFAIKQCATYWHFLGILWIFLFGFLTFMR